MSTVTFAHRRQAPALAQWNADRLHRMIGDPVVTAAILKPSRLAEVEALFKDDLDAFRAKRQKYLLYPP